MVGRGHFLLIKNYHNKFIITKPILSVPIVFYVKKKRACRSIKRMGIGGWPLVVVAHGALTNTGFGVRCRKRP